MREFLARVNLFVIREILRLRSFGSPVPVHQADGVDAFFLDWNDRVV